MAASVGVQVGILPTKLLGIHESWFEDLMLNVDLLASITPKKPMSLSEEIEQKRLARRYGRFSV